MRNHCLHQANLYISCSVLGLPPDLWVTRSAGAQAEEQDDTGGEGARILGSSKGERPYTLEPPAAVTIGRSTLCVRSLTCTCYCVTASPIWSQESDTSEDVQAYYYDEKALLSNEEFDNLKEDLIWAGSKVAVLRYALSCQCQLDLLCCEHWLCTKLVS